MFYTYTFLIVLLLVKYVETSIVSNVTCSANGDVYVRSRGQGQMNRGGVQGSGMVSGSVACLFATSEDTVCAREQSGDTLRIYGCLEPDSVSTLDVYLQASPESLLIVRIDCAADQARRRRRQTLYGDTRQNRPTDELSKYARLRRQDQDGPTDNETIAEEIRNVQTSVSFEVKLNFSSNDEISIACDPDGTGILYLSNPSPNRFRSMLAFSSFSRRKCNAEFLGNRRFVAVGGCNLNLPIIVAFSIREKHAPVIGGSMSNFKVYNINCSDPVIARGNVFPDPYDLGKDGAGNHLQMSWVAMIIAVLTLTLVYGIFFKD